MTADNTLQVMTGVVPSPRRSVGISDWPATTTTP
jgi:hypothetical protein